MQATAAHATSARALSLWQAEVEQLTDAIPAMPPAARAAVRYVLVALLDDDASDPGTRQDARRLLDTLARPRLIRGGLHESC